MRYSFYGKTEMTKLGDSWIYDDLNPEVVFSFGGDGTMLAAIHKYEKIIDKVMFVGIKSGSLGFFYSFEAIEEVLKNTELDNIFLNKYNLLEYQLIGEVEKKGFALNEIAITNPIHTQTIDVFINDQLFESFRGTGFIASTPAGSTAYSKSIGGSIIDPTVEVFQLVEIASINNRIYKTISSPLVFSKKYQVVLDIVNNDNIYISVDGKEVECPKLKKIKLSLSERKVNIINIKEDFFTKVKNAFLK